MQVRTKAFMMLEMLVVLLIITTLFFIIPKPTDINLEDEKFIVNYSYIKSESIAHKKSIKFPNNTNIRPTHHIEFNQNGTINMAQTINTNKGIITIYLGTSYLKYEK